MFLILLNPMLPSATEYFPSRLPDSHECNYAIHDKRFWLCVPIVTVCLYVPCMSGLPDSQGVINVNYTNNAEHGKCFWMYVHCTLACSIKPKSQMGISYPPNLVHILILLGFANKKNFLAVPEVRPNLTSSLAKNTKDFQN